MDSTQVRRSEGIEFNSEGDVRDSFLTRKSFFPTAAMIRKEIEEYFGKGKLEQANIEGQELSEKMRQRILAGQKCPNSNL
jgi:hypothetical protein